MKFNPGDVVILKSGGVPMTVRKHENLVTCDWFAGATLNSGTFRPDEIQLIS